MNPFIAVALLYCSGDARLVNDQSVYSCYKEKKMHVRRDDISETELLVYYKCKSRDPNDGYPKECNEAKALKGCRLTLIRNRTYDSEFSCSEYK